MWRETYVDNTERLAIYLKKSLLKTIAHLKQRQVHGNHNYPDD